MWLQTMACHRFQCYGLWLLASSVSRETGNRLPACDELSRVDASSQQREARGLTAMNFKPWNHKFDTTYEDYLRASGADPKLNKPSEAMMAAEPFHGCKLAISSSSLSILTRSSNCPANHIFSSNRQSAHNF